MKRFALAAVAGATLISTSAFASDRSSLEAMAASHAAANGLPHSLVHRVIMRESRYNPRAVSKGNYGIMQIRLGTARGLGYSGGAAGLLDPNTNMTYAVKYLAGAYKVAGGNHDRAVALYARGYYYDAKRQGLAHLTRARPGTADVANYSVHEQPQMEPRRRQQAAARQPAARQVAEQQIAFQDSFLGLSAAPEPARQTKRHSRRYTH